MPDMVRIRPNVGRHYKARWRAVIRADQTSRLTAMVLCLLFSYSSISMVELCVPLGDDKPALPPRDTAVLCAAVDRPVCPATRQAISKADQCQGDLPPALPQNTEVGEQYKVN